VTPKLYPTITQCTSTLAFIGRTDKREWYRFMTDSSDPNSTRIDTLWINQKRYNYINVDFAAIYTPPEGMVLPYYVEEFKFGIVNASVEIALFKVDRNGKFYFNNLLID
jgi:hypothetical protein